MKNPDKYIRAAYISALASMNIPVWDNKVPNTINPVPEKYMLLTSQSKNKTTVGKPNGAFVTSAICYEWICSITLDIYYVQASGYSGSAVVDDMEETAVNLIEAGINVPNFYVKNTEIVDTLNLPTESATQSINRKVIVFQHWLNER